MLIQQVVSGYANANYAIGDQLYRWLILAMTLKTKKVEDRRRGKSFLLFLEREVWPGIPPERLGRPLSRAEEDEILGYGPDGV